jgi:hypothetical protein
MMRKGGVTIHCIDTKRHLARTAHPGGVSIAFSPAAQFADQSSLLVLVGTGYTSGNVCVLHAAMETDFLKVFFLNPLPEAVDWPILGLGSFVVNYRVDFFIRGV